MCCQSTVNERFKLLVWPDKSKSRQIENSDRDTTEISNCEALQHSNSLLRLVSRMKTSRNTVQNTVQKQIWPELEVLPFPLLGGAM
jgi:hypothetical protein